MRNQMRTVRLVAISLCLAGCTGDLRLISFSQEALVDERSQWRYEKKTATLRNRAEELAVQAAAVRKQLNEADLAAAYLGNDGKYQLVAVVEGSAAAVDRFAPKKVTRYRILAGRVYAVAGPSMEPFPDAEFEKAVIIAARKAVGGTSVVPYDDGVHAVTLRGSGLGACAATVKVLDGYDSAGATLFETTVDFCDED